MLVASPGSPGLFFPRRASWACGPVSGLAVASAPRLQPTCVASVTWQTGRCGCCGAHHATLVAGEDLPAGAELSVAHSGPLAGAPSADGLPRVLVTFDGGARDVASRPGRVAGAAALLWSLSPDDLCLSLRAEAWAALPGEAWSPVAEAWGLHLGLQLLLQVATPGASVQVVGDNLSVVRFGAAQGSLRDPSHEGLLAPSLAQLALRGISPMWTAVRRRFNAAADARATEAVQWVATLAAADTSSPVVRPAWRW